MAISLKIDKALTLFRQNGLVSGAKKMISYGGNFFGAFFVPAGDILFIAFGVGDSAHYRTHGVAEELRLHGFRASVTIADNPNLLRLVDQFQIFIFHKTIYTKKIARVIEKIKAQGKEIIFDTDDLNFDPAYVEQMEYFKNAGQVERKVLKQGLGREILLDEYVKTATTTTTFLAKILAKKGKRVFVVTNKIDECELRLVKKLWETGKNVEDGKIYLGYFSGTPSHDRDFATITNVLVTVLKKYPKLNLILAGPLKQPEELTGFSDRIMKLPLVSRKKYYHNLQKADINLIPLEKTPFCAAKSELKFFCAGALGIPTIAFRNETFSGAIEDGVDGFLADGEAEWMEKLIRLITDEKLRKRLGEQAREKTLRQYTNANSNSEAYYNYLTKRLKKI